MDSNQNAVPNALVEDVLDGQEEEQVSPTPSPQPVQQQMGLSLPTYPWSNYRDPMFQQGTRQTTSTSQSQVPSQSMDRSRAELEAQARQRTLEMFGLNAAMFGAVTAPIPYSGRSTPAHPNGAYGPSAMASPSSTPAPFPAAQSPFVSPMGQLPFLLLMPQPQFNSAVQQPSFSLPVPQPQSAATTEFTTEINQLVQPKLMKTEAENKELRNENATLVDQKEYLKSVLRGWEKMFMDVENDKKATDCALEAKDEDFRKLTMESADNERELKEQLEVMKNEKEVEAKQSFEEKEELENTLKKNFDEYKGKLEEKDHQISSLEIKNKDLEGSLLDFQKKYAKLQKEGDSRIQLLTNFSDFTKDVPKEIRSIPSSHQVPLRPGKRASTSQRYSLRPGNKKAYGDDDEEDEED